MINKKNILDKLTQQLEAHLKRTITERSQMEGDIPKANITLMMEAYNKQEQALLQSLADLKLMYSTAYKENIVTEGSLIQVEIKELNTNKFERQWWLVLSCLQGKISSVNIDDQVIVIEGAYQYTDSLIGKTKNHVIRFPPIHGDNRDRIESIKIIEIH